MSAVDKATSEAVAAAFALGEKNGAAKEREACAVEVDKEIESAWRCGCDTTFLGYAAKHIRERGKVPA